MALVNHIGRILLRVLMVLSALIIVFFFGRYLIYVKIKKAIAQELISMESQGIMVTYDHIDINPWAGKMEVIGLNVKVRKDNNEKGLDVSIPYVMVKGVELIPFIRDRNLTLSEIAAENPSITYSKGGLILEEKPSKRKTQLNQISVGKINLPGIDLYVMDTVATDTVLHVLSSVNMAEIVLIKQLDSLVWNHGEIEVNDFAMKLFHEDYGVALKKTVINIHQNNIQMDSFRIQPTLSKTDYMKKNQQQVTYMFGIFPKIILEDVNWFTYPEASLEISKADLQLWLDMYRDKRLPFKRKEKRDLPSQFLHKLPFQITIDSISIRNSFARYEEFPPEGDSSGTVYFQSINAVITNVHNNRKRQQNIEMAASAKFMGAGILTANFTFPWDTLKSYHVAGTLDNFQIPAVNNMLGAQGNVKVESGYIDKLKFDFTYTDKISSGNLVIDYENLKILSLKNKNEEQAISHLKSMLINTIFVKKDVMNNVSSDERSGVIFYVRDQRRSVFNFWWKSIFSGVKSAFYLDKLPGGNKNKKKKSGKVKSVLSKIF